VVPTKRVKATDGKPVGGKENIVTRGGRKASTKRGTAGQDDTDGGITSAAVGRGQGQGGRGRGKGRGQGQGGASNLRPSKQA